MKKGLKFTKEKLKELYVEKKLSLNQIAKRFNCNGTNILYWLKKFNIKRRPAYRKKIDIPKKILKDLYWNKNLTTGEIAKKFGIKHGRTIHKKLKKLGIATKTISQATTRKFKRPFSENLKEKAYFLGLRAGDFYAKQFHKSVRIQTTTTHLAQVNLMKDAFRNYGETCIYLTKNKSRNDEWFIYTDLHPSFDFLLVKPTKIPDWILNSDKFFYYFFSAYIDCEGSWKISKSHEKHVRFTFRIRSGDLKILKQIKEKLQSKGYYPLLYLDREMGTITPYGAYSKNIYNLTLNRKEDIIPLIKKLLPLSKHSEKIRKMSFIIQNKNKSWGDIEKGLNDLRQEIKKELLKNQIIRR